MVFKIDECLKYKKLKFHILTIQGQTRILSILLCLHYSIPDPYKPKGLREGCTYADINANRPCGKSPGSQQPPSSPRPSFSTAFTQQQSPTGSFDDADTETSTIDNSLALDASKKGQKKKKKWYQKLMGKMGLGKIGKFFKKIKNFIFRRKNKKKKEEAEGSGK